VEGGEGAEGEHWSVKKKSCPTTGSREGSVKGVLPCLPALRMESGSIGNRGEVKRRGGINDPPLCESTFENEPLKKGAGGEKTKGERKKRDCLEGVPMAALKEGRGCWRKQENGEHSEGMKGSREDGERKNI